MDKTRADSNDAGHINHSNNSEQLSLLFSRFASLTTEDGAEGSMVEFGFGGKNGGEVVVERLGEVVEGEKESSEEEDDEDGSSEDDSGEESEVEESPTKKRKL